MSCARHEWISELARLSADLSSVLDEDEAEMPEYVQDALDKTVWALGNWALELQEGAV